MSLNREALKLYRDILRTSKLFTWPHESGVPWSVLLKQNARKEFEEARFEKDPLLISRMLYVGRDCLNQTTDKYLRSAQALNDKINSTRTS